MQSIRPAYGIADKVGYLSRHNWAAILELNVFLSYCWFHVVLSLVKAMSTWPRF